MDEAFYLVTYPDVAEEIEFGEIEIRPIAFRRVRFRGGPPAF